MEEIIVPIAVIAMAMMVPIVAILTKHQRSMAELFREERSTHVLDQRVAAENENLKRELAEMKALLYEQSIAIDNLGKSAASAELSNRLEKKI